MRILITHLGNINEILPATSVFKKIKNKIYNSQIHWLIKNKQDKYIFKYNKSIDKIMCMHDIKFVKDKLCYDALINLHPDTSFQKYIITKDIKNFLGFGYNDNLNSLVNSFNEDNDYKYNMSLFQIYYKTLKETWKGEGYDIGYHPKTKIKKNRIGIAVAHANLRNYIIEKLQIEKEKLWYVPYKKNIFKKMDEINKCKKIITDDLTTLHLSMTLRKYVYFLQSLPFNTKIELFNKGLIYHVPKQILQ